MKRPFHGYTHNATIARMQRWRRSCYWGLKNPPAEHPLGQRSHTRWPISLYDWCVYNFGRPRTASKASGRVNPQQSLMRLDHPSPISIRKNRLLDACGTAGFFDFALELLSFFFRDALFKCLRTALDQFLRLFQAETSQRANDLNYLNLLIAEAFKN